MDHHAESANHIAGDAVGDVERYDLESMPQSYTEAAALVNVTTAELR